VRQALVDSPPDAVRDAYVIDKPEFPFGFEFLDKVTFREVNFGEQAPDASPMTIAGAELNRPGFSICPECGVIQRRRKAEEMFRNHAPYCSKRKDPEATAQQCVFLYREFASEGIRLFLPEVGFGDTEERLLSFVSALELGLTRRFRGAVDHLRIALDIRMAAGQEIPRCYLVIYDSVPGGTGYLKELMRAPEPLLEVLDLALQALNECVCNQDAEADGCYRCVYAYHNSYDRESISRRIAQKLLSEVVQHKGSLKQVPSLSGVQTGNQLFDSTLEKRFVEALRRELGGKRYSLTEVLFKGKPGYQLQADSRRWRVELQVNLADSDGVVVACKPDFVLWPDDGADDLPIAVFLDGWQFHKDTIPVDLAKRMAVAKSGKFSVWTLTWDDIETALQGKDSATPSPWPTLLIDGGGNVVPKMCEAQGLPPAASGLKSLNPFMQLHQRLSDWRHEEMRKLGVALAIGTVMPPGEAAALAAIRESGYWRRLDELALLPEHTKHRFGARQLGSVVRLAAGIHPDHLASLMKAAGSAQHEPMLVAEWVPDSVPEAERQARWQQLWQCLNLLLPLRHVWAGTVNMPSLEALQSAPMLQQQATGLPAAWIEVMSLVLRETQAWAHALAMADLPAPQVGYELLDDKGRIVAESEMAWPACRVTALLPDTGAEAKFQAAGWTCFVWAEGPLPAALMNQLKEAAA
jgi:DEAD/DEAH box helicase domain-containing protein